MRYRKKPVVIEAIKCAELVAAARNNWIALPEWFREQYEAGNIVVRSDGIDIQTLEGTMTANLPDVVIRGVQGEIYPCKPDIFEKTYEPAEEP